MLLRCKHAVVGGTNFAVDLLHVWTLDAQVLKHYVIHWCFESLQLRPILRNMSEFLLDGLKLKVLT
jgi:hypothetical protein